MAFPKMAVCALPGGIAREFQSLLATLGSAQSVLRAGSSREKNPTLYKIEQTTSF